MSEASGVPVVVGLGLGDEGKGSVVDFLARELGAGAVVRWNGGPQAAHHVVTTDGREHCFAQVGSGALARGCRTLLGPQMVVDLPALAREAAALAALGVASPLERVVVHERCALVTPFHRLLNRMHEIARGGARHGSCGRGVAQAALDARNPSLPSVRAGEVREGASLRKRLRLLQLVKLDQAEQLRDARPGVDFGEAGESIEALSGREVVDELASSYEAIARSLGGLDDGGQIDREVRSGGAIFEGAQGVLLDEWAGFFPHVTPSCTTFAGAEALIEASARRARKVGVLRAYATRHGEGPFVSFDPALSARLPEAHNVPNPWQGPMRCGWFDVVAARYALEVAGRVDDLAVTCLDRLAGLGKVGLCVAYRLEGAEPEGLDELFEIERSGSSVVAVGIKPAPSPSYDRQRRLGEALRCFRPVTVELEGWAEAKRDERLDPRALAFARELAGRIGAGGARLLLSAGPTSADKAWVAPS